MIFILNSFKAFKQKTHEIFMDFARCLAFVLPLLAVLKIGQKESGFLQKV